MGLYLDTPVQYIKGVGPALAQRLARKSVYTVKDLLFFFPRAYEDRRAARLVSTLTSGETVSLLAQVVRVSSIPLGRTRRRIYEVLVQDSSGRIRCKYFTTPYKGYFDRFEPGTQVRVVGKLTNYRGQLEFHHPDILIADENEENVDEIVPIYPETEGLSSRKIQSIILKALSDLELPEVFPPWLINEFNFPTRKKALLAIHKPPKSSTRDFLTLSSQEHQRFIFEEFFWFEMIMAKKRAQIEVETGPQLGQANTFGEEVLKSLPFQLTKAQTKVLEEIERDMKKPSPMHRLVQGDVGSGKTVVAWLAASMAISNGYQTALMAPTEILAEQHYKNACQLFEPLKLKVSLLTGSMSKKERQEVVDELREGQVSVVVGTHALIQEGVEFQNLGLVIIDEQHRFGVYQRLALKQKGFSPHMLIMTATPIPRTLAMTVYGDLDVSVIDELPPGRTPVETKVVYESKSDRVYQFMADRAKSGAQAYIVYPLVEESEKLDMKAAVTSFEMLQQKFPDVRFGLLHGRMKGKEKEAVMTSFRDGHVQVLVSTTVIEVGVDVPNATLMILEHAERFGLSQIHQLRGRVGRGSKKSYCVLVLSGASSEEARQRCRIMESTQDGFRVAEADLEIRGPGELLGTRQSGLPEFRIANIIKDALVLQSAKVVAQRVISEDPYLKKPEHQELLNELKIHHGARWANIG